MLEREVQSDLMGRIFKDTQDETDGDIGPFVFLVLESGKGSNVEGVYDDEPSAHIYAEHRQKDADDSWSETHFWVEKHVRRQPD